MRYFFNITLYTFISPKIDDKNEGFIQIPVEDYALFGYLLINIYCIHHIYII